jgi:hypothetical protein
MKAIIILLILTFSVLSNEKNDGSFDNFSPGQDNNGDGRININDLPKLILQKYKTSHDNNNSMNMSFSQLWASPAGAFTNCWDGCVGYFDNDTLLDIAGFTFSPAKFYIWEQSPTRPDSFYLVQEFVKSEGGSFGAITFGDTDADGKIEIIAADVLGIARIYIYENNGDNVYVDQNTQNQLVHPSNSQGAQGLYIADLNKNGKKEIILLRGSSSPGGGEVRVWEHSGATGTPVYTNIYTYSTITYIFGKGGLGDGDNDGWDEIYLTYGGFPIYNTFIRRIEFDSASGTFQYIQFEAPSIGFPAMYRTYDLGNDGTKELIMTGNSNNTAACYIFRNSGANSFVKIDSIFETSDNNNMLASDIKVLPGNSQPTLLMGSFNGRVYTYQYNGSSFIKDYENLNYPGSAIRRVYWLPTTTYTGYFNTWSSTSSNGTYYIFKRDDLIGIANNQVPSEFKLYQNYPNPFNPETKISYSLSKTGNVKITIYDINGSEVRYLNLGIVSQGFHEFTFNAKNLSSGIYFYKFITGNYIDTKKMILLK